MNWNYLQGSWVLCPANPTGILHFLGGAFVASAPQVTYQVFLSRLASHGYCVIATPFLVQPDHDAIAIDVAQSFRRTYATLCQESELSHVPVFGVGHSLGSKLQLLLTCQNVIPRMGNILIAFNNFDSNRAIPFAEMLPAFIPLTFSPSPEETLIQVQSRYQQAQTLVLKFQTDSLDESHQLTPILQGKFPKTYMHQTLMGNHLTPLESDIGATAGQRVRLEQVTLKWLNYQQLLYQRDMSAAKAVGPE